MKNKRLLSFLGALLLTVSLSGCSNEKEDEELIEDIDLGDKYTFYLESDTYDVDKEVENLGIVNDQLYNYKSYKVIKCIDGYDIGKEYVTLPYVSYIVDKDGNIIDKEYVLYDAFSGTEIIRLKHNGDRKTFNMDIKNITPNEFIKTIQEEGNLELLKKTAIEKGMDQKYVNKVFNDNIIGKRISVGSVARIYVCLVNKKNRITFANEYVYTLK